MYIWYNKSQFTDPNMATYVVRAEIVLMTERDLISAERDTGCLTPKPPTKQAFHGLILNPELTETVSWRDTK